MQQGEKGEDTSVRSVGGYILSKKRNKTSMKEHTWQEAPCSSFIEEIEKKMDWVRKRTKKHHEGSECGEMRNGRARK